MNLIPRIFNSFCIQKDCGYFSISNTLHFNLYDMDLHYLSQWGGIGLFNPKSKRTGWSRNLDYCPRWEASQLQDWF